MHDKLFPLKEWLNIIRASPYMEMKSYHLGNQFWIKRWDRNGVSLLFKVTCYERSISSQRIELVCPSSPISYIWLFLYHMSSFNGAVFTLIKRGPQNTRMALSRNETCNFLSQICVRIWNMNDTIAIYPFIALIILCLYWKTNTHSNVPLKAWA